VWFSNITRGTGRELTRDEAMKIMDVAEEAGLIHSVYNGSAVTNVICNCCTDCCIFYYPLGKHGVLEKGVAKSRFQAEVEKCFGCGVCAVGCESEAIRLVEVRKPDYIPA
jgi:Pyruvate/2-oxoacid:ferredoxin oxidoreductase delta subunit